MVLLRRALIGGAIAWAAALPAATLVAVQAQPSVLAYGFALAVYVIGSAVCHQVDARSFHLWSHQMPVCARCTGIYAGAATTGMIVAVRGFRGHGSAEISGRVARAAIGVSTMPLLASLIYEWTTGVTPSNVVRAATGVVVGATVAWFVLSDGNGSRRTDNV